MNKSILFTIFSFLFFWNTTIAQQVDLRLVPRKDCAAGTYCVTIQLNAVTEQINLGTSDFMLSYDHGTLKYKGFLPINLDKLLHPNSAWDYCAIDGNSQLGLFHLTSELLNPNGVSNPVKPNQWLSVGTVCFDMLKGDQTPNIQFRKTNLQLNLANPNNGTKSVEIRNATGIDRQWALSCVDAPEIFHEFIGEVGTVIKHQPKRDYWHKVILKRTYEAPVVVANLSSYHGGNVAHIRVRNVTENSFEFRIEEWDYLDGQHTTEKVDYMVVEAGQHTLTDGTVIQAGTLMQNGAWNAQYFLSTFEATPIVMTQVVSDHTPHGIITRMRNIQKNSFDLVLQLEQGNRIQQIRPSVEQVGWIAMEDAKGKMEKARFYETGVFKEEVSPSWSTHQFKLPFLRSAVLIGQAQTTNGGTSATLRFNHLSSRGVEIFLEEDQSEDGVTVQVLEKVGYFLFEEGMLEAEWESNAPPEIIGEAGKIKVNQDTIWKWQPVITRNSYKNPIVVTQVNTYVGSDPVLTRVRKINSRRFDIMVQEWEHSDGPHAEEEVSWIIMEAGTYRLPNGKMIQAGTGEVEENFKAIRFPTPFNEVPVVTAQISSGNSWIPVIERMNTISKDGFQVKATREENYQRNGNFPSKEMLDYIAMEPMITSMGVRKLEGMPTGTTVNHDFLEIAFGQQFNTSPVLVTDIQSFNGSDVAGVRMKSLNAAKVELKIEEEQSFDEEVRHIKEQVACIAFETGFIAAYDTEFRPCVGEKGKVLKEVWTNIEGIRLERLYRNNRYPNSPNRRELANSISGTNRLGDNYGTRVRGYITPPHSGYYTFNVTGDNDTKLFLSTNSNPDEVKAIASIRGWTGAKEHAKFSSQTSKRIYLTAGRLYFFDLHHKEGVGGDHFTVYWKWENIDWRTLDSRYLFAYQDCNAQPRSSQKINFEIAANDETTDLQWALENESHSDYFEVQTAHSVDKFDTNNFKVLAKKEGSGYGIATDVNTYHFEDYIQLDTRTKYYRIKQVHLDGTIDYSPIRSVYLDKSDALIHLYPNPFVERLSVVFPEKMNPKNSMVDIEIVDPMGKVILHQEGNLKQSRVYEFNITTGNGIYLVNVKSGGYKIMSKKILRVKE